WSHRSDGAFDMTVELSDASGIYGCGRAQTTIAGGKGALAIAVDAGPCPSAAGSDGGTVTSSCLTAGWLFCDGFDDPTIDSSKWAPDITLSSITTDAVHVTRGARAAHFHWNAFAADGSATAYETAQQWTPVP